jgi:F0F1-type ATP synthase delta subunit
MAKFISRRRLARETVRQLLAAPKRQADIIRQLAGYLIAHKQVNQLDLVLQDIADELYVQTKHLSAEVVHAFELSDVTRQAIGALLKEATGARSIELQPRRNPHLLGGVIIQTPRAQLDTSLRRRLLQLEGAGK